MNVTHCAIVYEKYYQFLSKTFLLVLSKASVQNGHLYMHRRRKIVKYYKSIYYYSGVVKLLMKEGLRLYLGHSVFHEIQMVLY